MDILNKKGLSNILKFFLEMIGIGGLGILITLPLCLKYYLVYNEWFSIGYYYKLLGLLYPTGILALIIIFQIIQIVKNVLNNTPFSTNTVTHFNHIGKCSLLIAFLYLVALPFLQAFFMIVIFMTFTIVGFFNLILAQLFKKAIQFKEENELTI